MNRLVALLDAGRPEEAEAQARDLVGEYPLSGFAWLVLGFSLQKLGKDALSVLQRAARLLPGDAEAHCALGVALERTGRLNEAEISYRQAIKLNPGLASAHKNLGNVLSRAGRPELADASYQEAIRLDPQDAEARIKHGLALQRLRRFEEAEAALQEALPLHPQKTTVHNLLGGLYSTMLHQGLGHLDEAIESYQAALALDPADFQANLELKNIYFKLGRLIDAEELCRSALEANPQFAEMQHELSTTHAYLSNYKHVVAESDRAFELKPDHARMWEQRLYCFSYHPDLSAETIFNEFVRWGDRFPDPVVDFSAHDRNPNRRLRIGYVSPDFRRHTSRFYFWPLFANHDRNAFELFAYSNVENEVAWTRLFKGQFEHWRDIRNLDDPTVARMVREDKIDILVDLCSHMVDDRLGVFTLKPAPIQATWLGAAWTTGLKAIDHVLFDPHLAPEGTLARESIVRLPSTFLCFRPPEDTAEIVPPPCLKNGYVTFGYSGRTERLSHRTFRVWGELLRRLPTARLILDFGPFGDPRTQAYYRGFLTEHGVDISRVILRKSPNIFEGLNDIDIILDSFPHSGGTMLMDAFWMGVPAVALASRPPLGRICTSMLMNLGLPEWVATTEAEYLDKACGFASRPELLNELRLGMRERMRNCPLMDGPAFSRGVENAFRYMFDRWSRAEGQGPGPQDAGHQDRGGEE